ncbi:nucleoside deaminase [Haloferula chungangensis]|uniref:Nucleoside deaminase n=1 Tax=Haloferula chungangensis TaxID=1048331 RepID=A0ABW2L8T2_9BACT
MSSDSPFMRRAIELARKGMTAGHGGPFGAVVVRDGEIIGEGWNQVLRNNDPTAHGEVTAIRDACSKIDNFHLADCEIHTTGEPCPMCLGAIYWSRIRRIYYGFSIKDAAAIGFDDVDFYSELVLPAEKRSVPSLQSHADEARILLSDYKAIPNRSGY